MTVTTDGLVTFIKSVTGLGAAKPEGMAKTQRLIMAKALRISLELRVICRIAGSFFQVGRAKNRNSDLVIPQNGNARTAFCERFS